MQEGVPLKRIAVNAELGLCRIFLLLFAIEVGHVYCDVVHEGSKLPVQAKAALLRNLNYRRDQGEIRIFFGNQAFKSISLLAIVLPRRNIHQIKELSDGVGGRLKLIFLRFLPKLDLIKHTFSLMLH